MAYMVTFHGVTDKAIGDLRTIVQGYGFEVKQEAEGVAHGPDADVAFRFNGDLKTLDVSIRRKPLLLSYGDLYGMIADALIDFGVEFADALNGPENAKAGRD